MKLKELFNYGSKAYGNNWSSITRPDNAEALIRFEHGGSHYSTEYVFDFVMRMVKCTANNTANFIPFSQMDPEVLYAARDDLIGLGGKPPELPSSIPASMEKRVMLGGNKPGTP